MINSLNTKYNIILASQSPRRRQLLADLGLHFQVRIKGGIIEDFPEDMDPLKVASFLSEKKFNAYIDDLQEKDLLITADTIVLLDDKIIGKPENAEDAKLMLAKLSGRTHTVITGVSIGTKTDRITFDAHTHVTFAQLHENDIQYYIEHFRPFDKAGSYGIQEWIGYVGVERIDGSFYNVMGLPIQLVYRKLIEHFQK